MRTQLCKHVPSSTNAIRSEKFTCTGIGYCVSTRGGSRISESVCACVCVWGGGGSNPSRWGSFSLFYLIFRKFPHKIESWSQRRVQANQPNPSKSATEYHVICNVPLAYCEDRKLLYHYKTRPCDIQIFRKL